MSDLIAIQTMCPSRELAETIVATLLDEKLVACVSVSPPRLSMYVWEGKREKHDEHLVDMKTTAALYPKIESRIRELHSDDVPCILATPVTHVLEDYADWLRKAVS